jgi:hypothetical protein
MLRTALFATTAIAASLLVSGCNQSTPQSQDKQAQATDLATQPAPNAAERTAAEAANEVEQVAAPNAQITPGELANGLNGKDIPNPAATLSTASVKTSDGQTVGEVRSVVVGPDGKANAVLVEVGGFLNVGERAVAIDAKSFTYLKTRNILVVALAKSDIEKMPVAPASQN